MLETLDSLYDLTVKNELTQLIVYIIFLLFAVAMLLEIKSLLSRSSKLDKVLDTFGGMAQKVNGNDALNEQEQSLKAQYFSKLKTADEKILLTSYPPILANSSDQSGLRYMASILTSVGVIGTFFGIVLGLAGIEGKLNGDSVEMFEGAKTLLGSMSTAFITSLVGLVLSICLIFFLKLTSSIFKRKYSAALNKFNSLFRLETMADYLDKLAGGDQDEVIAKQLAAAQKSAEASQALLTMGSSLERAAENFDADKIGKHLSTSLDRIFTNEMVPVFTDISAELKSLREIKQDNGEKIIQAIMTQLRAEVIEPLSGQISETSSLVKESTLAVTKLHDELGDIAAKLADAVSTIQTFQAETVKQLGEFSADLRTILSSFQTDTKVILEGVADQLDMAVKASVAAMDDQKVAFKASAEQAATTFSGIKVELEQSLESQASVQKEMLDNTEQRVSNILAQSQKSHTEQVEAIKQVGATATGLMDSARENLGQTLSSVDKVLLETKETVTEQLDNFRLTYQQSLDAFFKEQNNLLESTLGEQRDGLARVVEDCRDTFKEEYTRRKELSADLGKNISDMQQATNIVNSLVQAVKLVESSHINQIEQTAKTIGLQVGKLEKSYSSSSELFGELLTQIPTELNTYFERANKSNEEFFTEMDKASAQIHTRLLQSAEYLISSETQRRMMNEQEEVT
ncbi:MotA/TolQ/ExbB proton channel family protein [Shewanella sp. 10N.286.48.A6]|uniref:MotA/TolQ/ExbB proton channel family protein n=1 Tax=Shewanella sp. 10N.286.48.A6 TaxID=1880833 RepID=UPI000C818146|nr:MotA/TolQ/ExbB proton channel family protein [Shewanella sp. 10N.286.48.A6]PMI02822.1 hypothetical protein BCU55_04375 [Shewanella sp. 10N.286.48.A6]